MSSWLETFAARSLEEIFEDLGREEEEIRLEKSLTGIPPDIEKILDDYRKIGYSYQINESVLANPLVRKKVVDITSERTRESPLKVFFLSDLLLDAVREDQAFQDLLSEPIAQLMLDLRNNPDGENPEDLIERHGFDRPQEQQYYTFFQRPDEDEAAEAEQMISRAFEVAKQSYAEGEDVRDICEVQKMLDSAWADYLEGDIQSRYEEFQNLPRTHYWHMEQDYPMTWEGEARDQAEEAWDELVYDNPPAVFELPEILLERWGHYEEPDTWIDSEGNEQVNYHYSIGKLIGDYCVENPDETTAMARDLARVADQGETDIFLRTIMESDAFGSMLSEINPRLIQKAGDALRNRMLDWVTASPERAEANREVLNNLAIGIVKAATEEVAEHERLRLPREGEEVYALERFIERMQGLRRQGIPVPWPEDELPQTLQQLRDRLQNIVPREVWLRRQERERQRRQQDAELAEQAAEAESEEDRESTESEEDQESAEAASRAWLEKWASNSRRAKTLSVADIGPRSVTASFDIPEDTTWNLEFPFDSRKVSVSAQEDFAEASFGSPRKAYHAVIWPEKFADAAGLESDAEILEFLEALSSIRDAASKCGSGNFLGGIRTAARSLEDIFEELGQQEEEMKLERQLAEPPERQPAELRPQAPRPQFEPENGRGEEDRLLVIGSDAVSITESNRHAQLQFDPPMLAAYLQQYGLRYMQIWQAENDLVEIVVEKFEDTEDIMEAMAYASDGLHIDEYVRSTFEPTNSSSSGGLITFQATPPNAVQIRQDVAWGPNVGLIVEAMWPSVNGSELIAHLPLLERLFSQAYNSRLMTVATTSHSFHLTVEGSDDFDESFMQANRFNNLLLRAVPTVYRASMDEAVQTPGGEWRRILVITSNATCRAEGSLLQEGEDRHEARTISRDTFIALAMTDHGLDAREVRQEDNMLSSSLFGSNDLEEDEFGRRVEAFCRHVAQVLHIDEASWGVGAHRTQELPDAEGELHPFHAVHVFFEMPEGVVLVASDGDSVEKFGSRSLEDIFDELGKQEEEAELERQLSEKPSRAISEQPEENPPEPRPPSGDSRVGADYPRDALAFIADTAFYRDARRNNRVVIRTDRLRRFCEQAGYGFSFLYPAPGERVLTIRLRSAPGAWDVAGLAEIIAEQPEVVSADVAARVGEVVALSIHVYSVPLVYSDSILEDEEDESGEDENREINPANARDLLGLVDSANLIFAAPPFINDGRIVLYLASPMEESVNERDMRAEVVRERISEAEGVAGATMNSTRREAAIYISFDQEHVPEEVEENPTPIQVDSDGIHFAPMELQRFLLWHGIQLDISTIEVREEDGTTEITFFVDRTSHFIPEDRVENVLFIAMSRFRNWYPYLFDVSITPDGSLLDVEIATNARISTEWYRAAPLGGEPSSAESEAGVAYADEIFSVRNSRVVVELAELYELLGDYGFDVRGVPHVSNATLSIGIIRFDDLAVSEDREDFDRQLASLQQVLETFPEVLQVRSDRDRTGAQMQLLLSSPPSLPDMPRPPFYVSYDGTTAIDTAALSDLMRQYGLEVVCSDPVAREDIVFHNSIREVSCEIVTWPRRLDNYEDRHEMATMAAFRAAGDLWPSRVHWSINGQEDMTIDFFVFSSDRPLDANTLSGWLRTASEHGSLEDIFEELGKQEEEMEIERQLAELVPLPAFEDDSEDAGPEFESAAPDVDGDDIEFMFVGPYAANLVYIDRGNVQRVVVAIDLILVSITPGTVDSAMLVVDAPAGDSETQATQKFERLTSILAAHSSVRYVSIRSQQVVNNLHWRQTARIRFPSHYMFLDDVEFSREPFVSDGLNVRVYAGRLAYLAALFEQLELVDINAEDFLIRTTLIPVNPFGEDHDFMYRLTRLATRWERSPFVSDIRVEFTSGDDEQEQGTISMTMDRPPEVVGRPDSLPSISERDGTAYVREPLMMQRALRDHGIVISLTSWPHSHRIDISAQNAPGWSTGESFRQRVSDFAEWLSEVPGVRCHEGTAFQYDEAGEINGCQLIFRLNAPHVVDRQRTRSGSPARVASFSGWLRRAASGGSLEDIFEELGRQEEEMELERQLNAPPESAAEAPTMSPTSNDTTSAVPIEEVMGVGIEGVQATNTIYVRDPALRRYLYHFGLALERRPYLRDNGHIMQFSAITLARGASDPELNELYAATQRASFQILQEIEGLPERIQTRERSVHLNGDRYTVAMKFYVRRKFFAIISNEAPSAQPFRMNESGDGIDILVAMLAPRFTSHQMEIGGLITRTIGTRHYFNFAVQNLIPQFRNDAAFYEALQEIIEQIGRFTDSALVEESSVRPFEENICTATFRLAHPGNLVWQEERADASGWLRTASEHDSLEDIFEELGRQEEEMEIERQLAEPVASPIPEVEEPEMRETEFYAEQDMPGRVLVYVNALDSLISRVGGVLRGIGTGGEPGVHVRVALPDVQRLENLATDLERPDVIRSVTIVSSAWFRDELLAVLRLEVPHPNWMIANVDGMTRRPGSLSPISDSQFAAMNWRPRDTGISTADRYWGTSEDVNLLKTETFQEYLTDRGMALVSIDHDTRGHAASTFDFRVILLEAASNLSEEEGLVQEVCRDLELDESVRRVVPQGCEDINGRCVYSVALTGVRSDWQFERQANHFSWMPDEILQEGLMPLDAAAVRGPSPTNRVYWNRDLLAADLENRGLALTSIEEGEHDTVKISFRPRGDDAPTPNRFAADVAATPCVSDIDVETLGPPSSGGSNEVELNIYCDAKPVVEEGRQYEAEAANEPIYAEAIDAPRVTVSVSVLRQIAADESGDAVLLEVSDRFPQERSLILEFSAERHATSRNAFNVYGRQICWKLGRAPYVVQCAFNPLDTYNEEGTWHNNVRMDLLRPPQVVRDTAYWRGAATTGEFRTASEHGSLEDIFEELGRQEEEMELERQLTEPVNVLDGTEMPGPASSEMPPPTSPTISPVPIEEVMGVGIEGTRLRNTIYVRVPALTRYLSYMGLYMSRRPETSDNDHRLSFSAVSFSMRRFLGDFQNVFEQIQHDMERSEFVAVRGLHFYRDDDGHVRLDVVLGSNEKFFSLSSNEAPSAYPFRYDIANGTVLILPEMLGPRFAVRQMVIGDFSIVADSIVNAGDDENSRYFRFTITNVAQEIDAEAFLRDVHDIVAEIDMMVDSAFVAGHAVIPRSQRTAEAEFRLMQEGRIVWSDVFDATSSATGWLKRAASSGSLEDIFEDLGREEEEMETERQLAAPMPETSEDPEAPEAAEMPRDADQSEENAIVRTFSFEENGTTSEWKLILPIDSDLMEIRITEAIGTPEEDEGSAGTFRGPDSVCYHLLWPHQITDQIRSEFDVDLFEYLQDLFQVRSASAHVFVPGPEGSIQYSADAIRLFFSLFGMSVYDIRIDERSYGRECLSARLLAPQEVFERELAHVLSGLTASSLVTDVRCAGGVPAVTTDTVESNIFIFPSRPLAPEHTGSFLGGVKTASLEDIFEDLGREEEEMELERQLGEPIEPPVERPSASLLTPSDFLEVDTDNGTIDVDENLLRTYLASVFGLDMASANTLFNGNALWIHAIPATEQTEAFVTAARNTLERDFMAAEGVRAVDIDVREAAAGVVDAGVYITVGAGELRFLLESSGALPALNAAIFSFLPDGRARADRDALETYVHQAGFDLINRRTEGTESFPRRIGLDVGMSEVVLRRGNDFYTRTTQLRDAFMACPAVNAAQLTLLNPRTEGYRQASMVLTIAAPQSPPPPDDNIVRQISENEVRVDVVAFGAMFISEGMDTDSYHRGDENDILTFTVVDFTEGRSAADFEMDLTNLLANFVQSYQSVETFAIDEAEVEPAYENSRNVRLYFTCEFDLSPSVTTDVSDDESIFYQAPGIENPSADVEALNRFISQYDLFVASDIRYAPPSHTFVFDVATNVRDDALLHSLDPADQAVAQERADFDHRALSAAEGLSEQVAGVITARTISNNINLSPSSSIHVTIDPDELEASEWHPLRESPAAIVRHEDSLVIRGTRMRLAMDRTAADLVELSLLPSDSPELSMVLDKRRGRSDEEFRQHVSWLLNDMEAMTEIILSEIRGGEVEGGRRVMVTVEFLGIQPVLNDPILSQFGRLEERREEESPLA